MQIAEKELNAKIMTLLRARSECSDARSIMLERISDSAISYNWRIVHFDQGTGDRYACKVALRRIHEVLRGDHEMMG